MIYNINCPNCNHKFKQKNLFAICPQCNHKFITTNEININYKLCGKYSNNNNNLKIIDKEEAKASNLYQTGCAGEI
jgi:peptide subunit release factor 1 (eRF1)